MMKKKESDGHLGIGVKAAETTTTTPEKTTVTVAEEGTARVGHLAFLHQWLLIRRPISLLRRFLHCPVPPSLSFLASSSALFPPLLSLGGPLSHFVLSPLVLMAMDPSSRSVWTIPDLPSPPMVRRRRHRLLISSHCAIGLRLQKERAGSIME